MFIGYIVIKQYLLNRSHGLWFRWSWVQAPSATPFFYQVNYPITLLVCICANKVQCICNLTRLKPIRSLQHRIICGYLHPISPWVSPAYINLPHFTKNLNLSELLLYSTIINPKTGSKNSYRNICKINPNI